jgi:phosphoglucosamine mutase
VIKNKGDIGFAYDGDGDRVIAVDSKGRVLDGDYIIAFCACRLKNKGDLKNNVVVTTIMANMGLDKLLEKEGIRLEKTAVGDRYVLERMMQSGSVLGGEQSGHIIFSDISSTGDGIISTLEFLNSIIDTGHGFDNIFDILEKYPQIIKNVKVADKKGLLSDESISSKISDVGKSLGDEGRVVVRPSGTEPLVRIMVEASSKEKARSVVAEIYDIIRKHESN